MYRYFFNQYLNIYLIIFSEKKKKKKKKHAQIYINYNKCVLNIFSIILKYINMSKQSLFI